MGTSREQLMAMNLCKTHNDPAAMDVRISHDPMSARVEVPFCKKCIEEIDVWKARRNRFSMIPAQR